MPISVTSDVRYPSFGLVDGLLPGGIGAVDVRFRVHPSASGVYAEMEMGVGDVDGITGAAAVSDEVTVVDLVTLLEGLSGTGIDGEGDAAFEMGVLGDEGAAAIYGRDPEFYNTGGVSSPNPRQFTFTVKVGF